LRFLYGRNEAGFSENPHSYLSPSVSLFVIMFLPGLGQGIGKSFVALADVPPVFP
jgi:hypothetical protein